MSTVASNKEFATRIERLEQFKDDFEKKLNTAYAVAAFFGLASLAGGAWFTWLTSSVTDLTFKTGKLQESLSQWDQQLASSLAKVGAEKGRALDEIDKQSKEDSARLAKDSERIASQHQDTLAKILEQKRLEATRSGSDDLVAKLTSGSLNLIVRGIQVRNTQGVTAAVLGADEKGDGFFLLNTDKGERRYLLNLPGKTAQSNFYGLDGKLKLTAGVFSDDNIGYLRFRDPTDTTTLLEIKSEAKGGLLYSYSNNGKNIVYLGPDSNTGNGLVNVMGIRGEATASHAPK